jgi:predicted amidohydrolase YtcJ
LDSATQRAHGGGACRNTSTQQLPRPIAHRIEHVQHLSSPEAAAQLARLGLAAVINPQHLLTDYQMARGALGAARAGAGRSFAFRTLLASGAPTAAGSDWPVVDVDPFQSVYAAAFRSWPPPPPVEAAGRRGTAEAAADAATAASAAAGCAGPAPAAPAAGAAAGAPGCGEHASSTMISATGGAGG